MNRLYVIESTPSSTGAKADHRLPLKASEAEPFARLMLSTLSSVREVSQNAGSSFTIEQKKFAMVAFNELFGHRGSSLLIAGDHLPPAVHALAHDINSRCGNVGKTVFYTDPRRRQSNQPDGIDQELAADMQAGKVVLLIILGGNPACDAPYDLLLELLKSNKVPFRVHYGLYPEPKPRNSASGTSIPHELESTGDARAYDGTVSIIQPLIAPLYNGKSAIEFVALLNGQADATDLI